MTAEGRCAPPPCPKGRMRMKRSAAHPRSEARGACRGLAQLPVWLVPPRWSNFSCWAQLGETLANQLRTLLAMPPALRDVGQNGAAAIGPVRAGRTVGSPPANNIRTAIPSRQKPSPSRGRCPGRGKVRLVFSPFPFPFAEKERKAWPVPAYAGTGHRFPVQFSGKYYQYSCQSFSRRTRASI